jgi:hypothetical protein
VEESEVANVIPAIKNIYEFEKLCSFKKSIGWQDWKNELSKRQINEHIQHNAEG